MNGRAYYNENDRFAAAWLRELIADRLVAAGDVDERSIVDVQPADLAGYDQCHFFAGIGGWSCALRLAGWPDERPVWTGSCPCQPLSVAGQRKGHADKRHLWPAFHRLIAECCPSTVFGEQVASAIGREWLAGIRADLEALGYAVGAADLCAAGVGAPHIRQRLYWVADAGRLSHEPARSELAEAESGLQNETHQRKWVRTDSRNGRDTERMADAEHAVRWPERETDSDTYGRDGLGRCGDAGGLGNANDTRSQGRREHAGEHADQLSAWVASVFIPCLDGKLRRVPANAQGFPESEIFPLAHGVSNRVGKLRGSGNAIVPQVAAAFIRAAHDPAPQTA